jgi:hypothetical protein
MVITMVLSMSPNLARYERNWRLESNIKRVFGMKRPVYRFNDSMICFP